jgi:hypothetical protein
MAVHVISHFTERFCCKMKLATLHQEIQNQMFRHTATCYIFIQRINVFQQLEQRDFLQ